MQGKNNEKVTGTENEQVEPVIKAQLSHLAYRRLFFIAVGVVLTVQLVDWVFLSLAGFLLVLLLAWLLAISIDPVVTALAKRGIRRGVGTGFVLGGVFFFTSAFLFLLGRALAEQVSQLWSEVPALAEQSSAWVNENFGEYIELGGVQDSLMSIMQADSGLGIFAGGILGLFTGLLAIIFSLFAVVVFAFYFAADRPRWERWIASWLKPSHQKVFVDVADISIAKAGGFVLSKIILAFLSSVAHVLFFWAIDVPFWLPMGIFAGVTSQFIPIIGTYLGIIVPAFFTVFNDPIDVVWIIVFATIYQQLENYVFTPKVSSKAMDVNSGVALGAVFIGVALFGPLGALIGIPLIAIIFAVLTTYGKQYELLPEVLERNEKKSQKSEDEVLHENEEIHNPT